MAEHFPSEVIIPNSESKIEGQNKKPDGNFNTVPTNKENKIQELLNHYTGDEYLRELLEDFKEGYDFNFDEEAIKYPIFFCNKIYKR